MNLIEFMQLFPDDDSAEQFFTEQRWPDGVRCPYCDSENTRPHKHKTMPHYLRRWIGSLRLQRGLSVSTCLTIS